MLFSGTPIMMQLNDRADMKMGNDIGVQSPASVCSASTPSEADVQTLGAIIYRDGQGVDPVIAGVVQVLRAEGVALCGVLQHEVANPGNCCASMYLENISNGTQLRLSQELGSGSQGCRLNPHTLAESSGQLLQEMDGRPDLLVLNRFGKGEAEGHGFRAVLEKAHQLQIPVLIGVKETYRSAWDDFAGDFSRALKVDSRSVVTWCTRAIAERRRVADDI